MPKTLFYAWQSDCHRNACRFLIRDAIKAAIKKLKADATLKDAPPLELDHDTKGVPGHPHIAATIRRKIRKCDVFIADLTHVAKYTTADGRDKFAQNGNVQIELGIAIRAKGFERLILVMNTFFGGADGLPFDLKSHSYPVTYEFSPADVGDGARIKATVNELADALKEKLKVMLGVVQEDEAAKLKAKAEAEANVQVTCQLAFAGVEGSGEFRKYLTITAVNIGTRPVTISQARIDLSDGRRCIPASTTLLGPWRLPKRLEESDKVDVLVEVEPVYQELAKARAAGKPISLHAAAVTDTAGRTYRSQSLAALTEDALKPI